MHIIYLAGNSLNNKTWIEKVKANFDSFSMIAGHGHNPRKFVSFNDEHSQVRKSV